jgi:hypothetical protein
VDECIDDFIRLLNTNGFLGSCESNSLTYDMFRNGFYVAGFDLTTAQEGANDIYSIPTMRTGKFFSNNKFAKKRQH